MAAAHRLTPDGLTAAARFRPTAALVACILAMTERAPALALVLHRTARRRAASASARACLAHARAIRACLRSSAGDIPIAGRRLRVAVPRTPAFRCDDHCLPLGPVFFAVTTQSVRNAAGCDAEVMTPVLH